MPTSSGILRDAATARSLLGTDIDLARLGGETDVSCGAKYAAFVDSEPAKWSKLVKDANIKIEN